MSDEFKKELEQLKKGGEKPGDEADKAQEDVEFDDMLEELKESTEEELEKEQAEKEEMLEEKKAKEAEPEPKKQHIFALRTTANREDQVMDFVTSNAKKKKLGVLSVIRPHGMRGYIFIEALARGEAEQAAYGVPYARGILPNEIEYSEIEHMLEQVKKEINIRKNDIAEIISGPFKREKCKVTRIDKTKEEVVVELLEAAVPIPITVKMDAIKVIRRDSDEPETEEAVKQDTGVEIPPAVESRLLSDDDDLDEI